MIVKDKTYAIINVVGLTVGLCACMLMATVVLDDISYDRFWTHRDALYRIVTVDTTAGLEGKSEVAYSNLGIEMANNLPEISRAAAVQKWQYDFRKTKADEEAITMDVIVADTNIWGMLDFAILAGSPRQYTPGINNLIISERFRKTHFVDENPIGKTIYSVSTYDDEAKPFLITGVMADLPTNTYLRADGLEITQPASEALSREGWGNHEEQLVLMKPNTDMAVFTAKANRWYRNFLADASELALKNPPLYEFQPITDIYLNSEFAYQEVKGSWSNIYIFSVVAVLLLAIACINFVNLNTVRIIRRFRETGVRKVLGATRRQLIHQVLTESLLFFSTSALLAFALYGLALAPLERFLTHGLAVDFMTNLPLFAAGTVAVLLIAVLTSIYPAIVLSGFKTTSALRNRFAPDTIVSISTVRKVLVATQFSFALLVLIAMITVWRQMQFIANKDLGYNTDHILTINSFSAGGKGGILKQEIAKLPGVAHVSLSEWLPTQGTGGISLNLTHPKRPYEHVQVNIIFGDRDLPTLLGLRVEEGRLFDQREATIGLTRDMLFSEDKDTRRQYRNHAKVILMASTASLFDITSLDTFVPSFIGTPIGIVSDFHSVSLHNPIKPTMIHVSEDIQYPCVLIKVMPGYESQVMRSVNQLWKHFHDEKPLQLQWLDDMVKSQYEKEAQQAILFKLFTALTLFLAVLGLLGLVVHSTAQRVKEIGVRKVLGASVGSIVRLFVSDYIKLVTFALIVATPIAWWAMNLWLEDFAYRIEIQWWMFALAGLVAVVIALLTISGQAIRAASANPVNSLRAE